MMKLPKHMMLTVAVSLLSTNTFAFEAGGVHKEVCKPPKMLEFNLPEYSADNKTEVPPQSAFSFKLSGGTAAENIQVFAKEQLLTVDITSNSSFTTIKGKIPADMTGKFVRLNVIVKTELGCMSRDGWLVKVAAQ